MQKGDNGMALSPLSIRANMPAVQVYSTDLRAKSLCHAEIEKSESQNKLSMRMGSNWLCLPESASGDVTTLVHYLLASAGNKALSRSHG